MRSLILPAILLISFASCKKTIEHSPSVPPANPVMNYTDLKEQTVYFNNLRVVDVDEDGQYDIFFSTQLVGDPVNQVDKMQWMVSSSYYANLLVKDEAIPVLNKGDSITIQSSAGHGWYNASQVVLARKIISFTQDPYWEGGWKQASHQYVPIQVIKGNELFNGWVEISFNNEDEMLILHRAAISTEANKNIEAGS